ncbi:unnamed protein product [Durusdinium trenchii]|uniref:Uncharacterized protein n=2 Tax=Durusdinium trenchii TaxID=1381693 RepID=A0ABP0LC36_9DINO
MASLNISKMVLDKDSWENIPPMVFKSFQTTNTNMFAIKKWADFYESRAKSQTEFLTKMEEKLTSMEHNLGSLQERMLNGEQNLASESDTVRQQALTCAHTFQRMEACLALVFRQLGQTFGVHIDCAGPPEPASAASPLPGSAEEPEGEEREEREEEAEKPDGVSLMKTSLLGLEKELEAVKMAFDKWREGHAEDEQRYETIQSSIQDLQHASGESQGSISTCQELLEEHSRASESLRAELAQTQASVQELHSTRVQQEDVEAAIQQNNEELEAQSRKTDDAVDRLGRRLEEHVSEVQRLVSEMGRQTDERVEDYSNQVAKMVEGHMNPLNAYLNTMHVKIDVIRVDLDKLKDQAPRFAASIEQVTKKLQDVEEVHESKSSELNGSMEDLRETMAKNVERHDGQHGQLSKSMKELSQDLERRLVETRSFAERTSESLELVKQEDLSGLARELLILDQKVAKWVHSTPLPARISEARLYSLEARLADEMDARIAFECKVRKGLQTTPREPSDDVTDLVLPQLSQESFGPGYAKNGPPSGRRRLAR